MAPFLGEDVRQHRCQCRKRVAAWVPDEQKNRHKMSDLPPEEGKDMHG